MKELRARMAAAARASLRVGSRAIVAMAPDHESRPSSEPPRRMTPRGDQCRCGCGSMLARVVREGLELKCRRCRSLVLITHDELIQMYRALDFDPPAPGEHGPR